MNSQTYYHVQHSPLHILLYIVSAFIFIAAWQIPQTAPSILIILVAVSLICFALCFRTLTVFDQDDHLVVRYGPLNVFGTRIPYSKISSVEFGHSSLIDGWGIHFIPFRGWTFNLWGFECAILHLHHKTIRIGSDDAKNLVAFLNSRLEDYDDYDEHSSQPEPEADDVGTGEMESQLNKF